MTSNKAHQGKADSWHVTRQNKSESPKHYPLQCNPLTRTAPKIKKLLFWGKATPKQQKPVYHIVTCKFPIISLQCHDVLTL